MVESSKLTRNARPGSERLRAHAHNNSFFDRPRSPARQVDPLSQRQRSILVPHDEPIRVGDLSNSVARKGNASGPNTSRASSIICGCRPDAATGAAPEACRTPARLRRGANSLISCRSRSRYWCEKSPARIANPFSSMPSHQLISTAALSAAPAASRDFLRRDLQHRSSADMHKTQFPRRQQRVDGILHLRSRDEVSEEYLEVRLLDRDHAIQILRQQRRERLLHRKSHAFFHCVRSPAVKHIPHRAFARPCSPRA